VQLGRDLIMADSKRRVFNRMVSATLFALARGISAGAIYCLLSVLLSFFATENCYFPCDKYFEPIFINQDIFSNQKEICIVPQSINVYSESDIGNLIIAPEDKTKQLAIYVPSRGESFV
jgi:hypothetical protein